MIHLMAQPIFVACFTSLTVAVACILTCNVYHAPLRHAKTWQIGSCHCIGSEGYISMWITFLSGAKGQVMGIQWDTGTGRHQFASGSMRIGAPVFGMNLVHFL